MAKRDKRAKYRTLPPPVDPVKTVESADTTVDDIEDNSVDMNQGAGPYLRTILGPWAR